MASNLLTAKIVVDNSGALKPMEDLSLRLKDQRAILKNLQAEYAKLSTSQVSSPFGKELAADIKIANSEIKRLEAGATPALGNIGKAANDTFGNLRKIAYILPGIGIAGIFDLAFQSIGKVLSGTSAFEKQLKEIGELINKASKDFIEASVSIETLRNEIDLAKNGLASKESVLKDYNETIGKTTGLVSSLDEAESELNRKADAYIQFMYQKAIATAALEKAAQGLLAQVSNTSVVGFGSDKIAGFLKGTVASELKSQNASIQREIDAYKLLAKTAQNTSKVLAAAFGFNPLGDNKPIKVPNIKVQPAKVTIEKPQILDLQSIFSTPEDLRSETQKGIDKISKVLSQQLSLIKIPISPTLQLTPNAQGNADTLKRIRDLIDSLNKDLTMALKDTITGSLEGFGEGFGNLLSGKGFGNQIFDMIGSFLQKIGKALIALGTAGVLVKTIFKDILGFFSKNPVLAIGAGIAAIAAGTALKNSISGARAAGGPVSAGGTYLVGERGPELFTPNTGGNIVPNHALNQTGASLAGGMTVRIVGEFRQSGQDLIAAITLANQSKARLI